MVSGGPLSPDVLVLTVGIGHSHRIDATLVRPILLSVSTGQFKRVVLLPSRMSASRAAELEARLSTMSVAVEPLPREGDEDDADACFAHFDRVLSKLLDEGIEPHRVVADFTRGTKAMSAALVLAATRRGIQRLRYVSGVERDAAGVVVPGTEVIRDVLTTEVTARRALDLARRLVEYGDFAAALRVLPAADRAAPPLWPEELLAEAEAARPIAAFFASWDRLDHRAAAATVQPARTPTSWRPLRPSADAIRWVQALSRSSAQGDRTRRLDRMRRLLVDLVANAERRLRDRQYDDAMIRAYRVLELVGQLRLEQRGIDPGAFPVRHRATEELERRLRRNRRRPLYFDARGNAKLGREHCLHLLAALGDPLAKELERLGSRPPLTAESRNQSILIHGFEPLGIGDPAPLERLLKALGGVVEKAIGPRARHWFRVARSCDHSAGE